MVLALTLVLRASVAPRPELPAALCVEQLEAHVVAALGVLLELDGAEKIGELVVQGVLRREEQRPVSGTGQRGERGLQRPVVEQGEATGRSRPVVVDGQTGSRVLGRWWW